MDPIFIFIGLIVIITIGGLIFILSQSPKGPNPSTKKIEGTNFVPSQMYMGSDGLGGVAVNEHTHQICLFQSPSSPPIILPIVDLVGSYLIKNGDILGEGKRSCPKETVTFVSGLRRSKEALIKRLHMESSQGPNQRIDLFLLIHDHEKPIHVVNFLDMETKEGGILFEKAMSTATHWHYVLDGLILQADHLKRFETDLTENTEMAEATR